MKNFLEKHGLWILLAAAVISVTLALLSVFSNTASPLRNLAGVLSSPFRSAYSSVAGWFNEKQDHFADVGALKEENARLRRQIAEMEADIRQAESDSDENARLRRLLDLREQQRDFDLESARITERSSSNWTSSLTLSCGTNYDVAVGDCVITESYQLVGLVSEVGYNWCTVLTVVDTDTSLGAKVFRTGNVGLAQGDFNLMGEGLLKLSYLPMEGGDLLGGDLVVTSGLGGFYPSGLLIGYVQEVQQEDSGAADYAVLLPAADLAELQEVFIIKDFTIVD